MSVQAIVWILEDCPDLPKHLVATMVGLANHADQDGRGSYPSQGLLAWYARKDERSIRRDLDEAEKIGVIRRGNQRMVLHLPEDKRPVVYDLAMERKRPPRPDTRKGGRPKRGTRPETSQVSDGARNRADVDVKTGGTSTSNRGDVDVRQTALEPSLEPSPPSPPQVEPERSEPVEAGGKSENQEEQPGPTQSALDELVNELATAGRWSPSSTRKVLDTLADRGVPHAEIVRVMRDVVAGKHGVTHHPQRMLTWWPPASPAWAEGPHKYLAPGTRMCRKHPGQPAGGCGGCKGDQVAIGEPDPAPRPEEAKGMTGAALARHLARQAKTGRAPHRGRKPEPAPAAEGPAPERASALFGALTAAIGGRL